MANLSRTCDLDVSFCQFSGKMKLIMDAISQTTLDHLKIQFLNPLVLSNLFLSPTLQSSTNYQLVLHFKMEHRQKVLIRLYLNTVLFSQ